MERRPADASPLHQRVDSRVASMRARANQLESWQGFRGEPAKSVFGFRYVLDGGGNRRPLVARGRCSGAGRADDRRCSTRAPRPSATRAG